MEEILCFIENNRNRPVRLDQLCPNLKNLIENEMRQAPDVELIFSQLINFMNLVKRQILDERNRTLILQGLPEWYRNLIDQKTDPFTVNEKLGNEISGLTVTSTTAKYFSPWTAAKLKENAKRLPEDYMTSRRLVGSVDSNPTEAMFHSDCQKHDCANYIKRNVKRWINPSLPWFSCTPDAILWGAIGEPLAVIEVKGGNAALEGLKIVEDENKNISVQVRRGHEVYTQLTVQMITLRVFNALLVVRDADKWMVATIQRDEIDVSRFVNNILGRFSPAVLSLSTKNSSFNFKRKSKKAGRPKKKKIYRQRSNFGVHGVLCGGYNDIHSA